ncbi:MAG: FAD-dependent oxidoreductase [Methylovulum sp.]|jgi:glycine oxidase|nr:FAD-dependent oxidoreductase [Methylovulum sp.]MCF7998033.1 FAD-dependent oxidoreductase [Methylovulum sp.]
MKSIPDMTIIGGGVIGMLTAREFINAGASVMIIEKNQVGQESSWAGGGILLPLYPWRQAEAITRLALQSLKLYPKLAEALHVDTGIDPEWLPCGMLMTQNPDIDAAIHWCQSNRITFASAESERLDGLHTQALNPLWLPDIAQARNPRLIKSLTQDLLNKQVQIVEQCELTAFKIDNQRITHLCSTQQTYPVSQVIVASGAWTAGLLAQFLPRLETPAPDISPIKGQMVLFDAEPGFLNMMVLDGDRYLIPRKDGKILVGSTVEQDAFNKTTTPTAKAQLSAFALELLPALAQYPLIKHWAGLRPGTQQGIPYIDCHPEISNLSINAGHFRNGLVMGPASAELLVDILLKRPPKIDPKPYQLSSPH